MKTERIPEPQLHADLMEGWAKAIARKGGAGAFATSVEMTPEALKKQLGGSMPSFKTIIAAFQDDNRVLDAVMARLGKRICDQAPTCDIDDLSVLLARVLLMVSEAEHPDSPGGRAVVHPEYLAGEAIMRELHAMSGRWLEKCTEIRAPLHAVRA